MFINRPTRYQDQYYSGKYKKHFVKVQVLVTSDGQCVHCSEVFRGRTHDKATFDTSGLSDWLVHTDEQGRERQKWIMDDLGYLGITRTCPEAILPQRCG
jgi:hypothetical protein